LSSLVGLLGIRLGPLVTICDPLSALRDLGLARKRAESRGITASLFSFPAGRTPAKAPGERHWMPFSAPNRQSGRVVAKAQPPSATRACWCAAVLWHSAPDKPKVAMAAPDRPQGTDQLKNSNKSCVQVMAQR
jgi:hypothetical protein